MKPNANREGPRTSWFPPVARSGGMEKEKGRCRRGEGGRARSLPSRCTWKRMERTTYVHRMGSFIPRSKEWAGKIPGASKGRSPNATDTDGSGRFDGGGSVVQPCRSVHEARFRLHLVDMARREARLAMPRRFAPHPFPKLRRRGTSLDRRVGTRFGAPGEGVVRRRTTCTHGPARLVDGSRHRLLARMRRVGRIPTRTFPRGIPGTEPSPPLPPDLPPLEQTSGLGLSDGVKSRRVLVPIVARSDAFLRAPARDGSSARLRKTTRWVSNRRGDGGDVARKVLDGARRRKERP